MASLILLSTGLLSVIFRSSHAFVIPQPSHTTTLSSSASTFQIGAPEQQQQHQGILQGRRKAWHHTILLQAVSSSKSAATATLSTDEQQQVLQDAVQEFKQVLWEEYTSMFNPMRREFYATDVTFDDPLTTLRGVDAYQQNVDMLGSRNWLGAILFDNANIVLHSVEGGQVVVLPTSNDKTPFQITELTTRWTLSMTFQAFPWKPTARFTGISIYQVEPVLDSASSSTQPRIRVLRQQDYWDSINLQQGGRYQKVDTLLGLQDLLKQLFTIPNNDAKSKDLSFQLLRRAKTYQIRQYSSFTALEVQGDKAALAEAQASLKQAGLENLFGKPATIFNTRKDQEGKTTRSWWLPLGPSAPRAEALSRLLGDKYPLVTIPSQVVAVAECPEENSAAQVERQLRETLIYDGIKLDQHTKENVQDVRVLLTSLEDNNQNGSEVWIPLPNGSHPWSN